jgi:hypothetical protein
VRSNASLPAAASMPSTLQPLASVTLPAASSDALLTNGSAPSALSNAAAIISWPGGPGWTASPCMETGLSASLS